MPKRYLRPPYLFPLLLLSTLLMIQACGIYRGPVYRGQKPIDDGVASWYGPKFHGRQTANGERYDMYAFTAAHRTLPFNTHVKVVNLDNGKSTVVRINDRGPYAKNRVIDLSKAAAQRIGMIGNGTAHVALYVIKGEISESDIKNINEDTFTVQLASFSTFDAAKDYSQRLNGAHIEKVNLEKQTVYRVYMGNYHERNKAEQKRKELARQGFHGFVKQLQN